MTLEEQNRELREQLAAAELEAERWRIATVCELCDGNGYDPDVRFTVMECPACDGNGKIRGVL